MSQVESAATQFPRLAGGVDAKFDNMPTAEESRQYVEVHLKATLVKALTELVKARPNDQIRWISDYLLKHNPNKPAVQLGRNS